MLASDISNQIILTTITIGRKLSEGKVKTVTNLNNKLQTDDRNAVKQTCTYCDFGFPASGNHPCVICGGE